MAISYNIHIVHSREEVERQDISANIFSMSTYCLLQLFKLFATTLCTRQIPPPPPFTRGISYSSHNRALSILNVQYVLHTENTFLIHLYDFDHAQSKKKIICFFILVTMCTLVQCTLAHRYNNFLKHCYDLT